MAEIASILVGLVSILATMELILMLAGRDGR